MYRTSRGLKIRDNKIHYGYLTAILFFQSSPIKQTWIYDGCHGGPTIAKSDPRQCLTFGVNMGRVSFINNENVNCDTDLWPDETNVKPVL